MTKKNEKDGKYEKGRKGRNMTKRTKRTKKDEEVNLSSKMLSCNEVLITCVQKLA